MLQGLELLETADAATTLTRPLPPLFYATENFAKAACVFKDVSLNHSDFRAHGLSGDKNKRYSIKNLACRVNQPGRDVWSHAVTNLNIEYALVKPIDEGAGTTAQQGCGLDARPKAAREPDSCRCHSVLGRALRQLPEVAEDVRRAAWGPSYVVWAKTYHFTFEDDTPESGGKADLTLCHQHVPEIKAMLVERQNVELRRFALTVDEMDVMQYVQTFTRQAEISMPLMRSDLFGAPWDSHSCGYECPYDPRSNPPTREAEIAGLVVLRRFPINILRIQAQHRYSEARHAGYRSGTSVEVRVPVEFQLTYRTHCLKLLLKTASRDFQELVWRRSITRPYTLRPMLPLTQVSVAKNPAVHADASG